MRILADKNRTGLREASGRLLASPPGLRRAVGAHLLDGARYADSNVI